MANTHSLSRQQRKYVKRHQRRDNKALFVSLTKKDRNEMAESEKSLKGYLKEKGRL